MIHPVFQLVQLAQKILNGIYSQVSSRIHEARKPFKSASNKQIKTYSFRRMLSFRGSLRGPGARRSNSGTSAATAASYATGDSASSSPGLQPQHRLIKLRTSFFEHKPTLCMPESRCDGNCNLLHLQTFQQITNSSARSNAVFLQLVGKFRGIFSTSGMGALVQLDVYQTEQFHVK